MKSLAAAILALTLGASAFAKLPPPSEEAKAKAAETAAKTAHTAKVDAYLLCKAQDRTATAYYKSSKAAGKETKPATSTPACADPGSFVYVPAAPAGAASAAVAAAPAAAAASAAVDKKAKKTKG